MMSLDVFEWFPPEGGQPLIFSDRPYVIRNFNGLGVNPIVPEMQKSPFQVGETLLNARVSPRVFSLSLRVVAGTKEELAFYRRELARAMTVNPVRQTGEVAMGLFRFHRPEGEPLELFCLPQESPQFTEIDGAKWAVDADLEFVAPYPFWQDAEDSLAILAAEVGGLKFAVSFPMEIGSANVERTITNAGDIPAPILARVFGEVDTFRLLNLTTGEALEVLGPIAPGDFVEVNTAFGEKSIRYFDTSTGTSSDIFNRLVLGSSFWSLRRGSNLVRFEADVNVSGSCNLFWRQRYSGI